MSPMLSSDECARFQREGWIGPYRLFPAEEARRLAPELQAAFARTPGYLYPGHDEVARFYEAGGSYFEAATWFQSLHALSPRLLEVGRHPAIVERVAQLLGPDLMLWATIYFLQAPRERLHWHSDVEFHFVRGVSVWLGISEVTPANSLKILPGSHHLPTRPEDFLKTGRHSMEELQDDALALRIAREQLPTADFVRPALRDGEFILFNGNLWHASDNPGDALRVAMGLRYSPPDQEVRIPMTAWEPVHFDPARPPTVMVRGEDRFGRNARL